MMMMMSLLAGYDVASPQTSFGVRLSRIQSVGEKWMRDKRTSKDVCGEARYDDKDGDVNDNTREFKLHVYGKRQMSDSSWEFLKIENEQTKTAQNNSYG